MELAFDTLGTVQQCVLATSWPAFVQIELAQTHRKSRFNVSDLQRSKVLIIFDDYNRGGKGV